MVDFGCLIAYIQVVVLNYKMYRFLDFGLATAKDVPRLLNEYVHYYNNERPAAALGYKSPVQYKTELGF